LVRFKVQPKWSKNRTEPDFDNTTSNSSSINDAKQSNMSGCEDVDDELEEVFDNEAEEDIDDECDNKAAEEIDDKHHSDDELHEKFDTEGLAHDCVVSEVKRLPKKEKGSCQQLVMLALRPGMYQW
jgi:hypothetical protein